MPRGKTKTPKAVEITAADIDRIPEVLPKIQGVDSKVLTKVIQNSAQAHQRILPIIDACVVTSHEEFQAADAILSQIIEKRKEAEGTLEPIIRPIRTGLDILYALNRALVRPWTDSEARVKSLMADYQVQERKRLETAEREKEIERKRIQEKMVASLPPEVDPSTVHVSVMAPVTVAAPTAQGSSTRAKKVPIVVDKEALFLHMLMDDSIPMDLLQVDQDFLLRLYEANPDKIAAVSGVRIEEKVTIAAKARRTSK